MTGILNDLSTPALADAIKANLYKFFRYFKRSPRAEVYETPHVVRWHTSLPHPWFNGVLSTSAAPDTADQIIQETLAYFELRNVAGLTWWFEPGLPMADWGERLQAHGFRYDENTPGMAVDLSALNDAVKTPPNFTIASVENLEALKEWTRTFIAGFKMPEAWEAGLFDLMSDLGFDLPIRNYTGYRNGKPVATSNLFLAAGVAGIYFVATLPEARGQGIGAAMTLTPLWEAQQMGYRAGILQSSELGFPVYRRLGFEKLCAMDHYYRQGAEHDD